MKSVMVNFSLKPYIYALRKSILIPYVIFMKSKVGEVCWEGRNQNSWSARVWSSLVFKLLKKMSNLMLIALPRIEFSMPWLLVFF